jgi:hypothetical protein
MNNGLFETFRIYVNRTRHKKRRYYRVSVFKNRDAMLEYYRLRLKHTGCKVAGYSTAEAAAIGYYNSDNPRDIGEMIFYVGFTGYGVVAHEISHHVFWLNQRRKMTSEQFAWFVGDMCGQFWRWWYNKRTIGKHKK